MKRQLTIVDLFGGAGGLSLGFVRAGFRPLLAVDDNRAAVQTYAHNLGEHVRLEEISEEVRIPQASVIIGGPPCQGFSSAGLRKRGDRRNTLVACFAEVVARCRPRAFVFENVEGFLTSEGGARVRELLQPLIRAGYLIHLRKINAANYGVPQHRKRVIAIGGLGWEPSFPQPTHRAFGAPGSGLTAQVLPPTPSVAKALKGLPRARIADTGNSANCHSYRPLRDIDLKRVQGLRPGQTMRDLPEHLRHSSYNRRANRRVRDGMPTERRGGAPAGMRRLIPDNPSKAITGGARTEFIHPSEDRFLTLRECARIQTFPDDFQFFGSLGEMALLIGNAVPPLLGTVIAESMAVDLRTSRKTVTEGALISFVPTLSSGLSPALKHTCDMVLSVFGCQSLQRELPLS